MKILVSAFACEPGLGSEEGVGWGYVSSLAEKHDVHVLTRTQLRGAIESELAARPRRRLTFSYFDFPRALVRCVITSTLWHIYYHAWQYRIASWARATAEAFDPDVVHHLTYGRYWTPCSLWKLGRPLVWGPLGGGDACPTAFLHGLSFGERIQAGLRQTVQWIAMRDPSLRATAANVTLAVASTPATAEQLRELGCRRVVALLQMALQPEPAAVDSLPIGPPVFCSVGRLLGWKGHALTLRAFARARIPGARLVILGEGPAKDRLLALSRQLGIDHNVDLPGAVPRREVLRRIAGSTALIHASLHDQAPTAVFEAMAARKPVIALALGGVSLQVTSETGFLVRADTPEQAVADLASSMEKVAASPYLCAQLGAAGRQRIEREFTWGKKVDQFLDLYRAAMVHHNPLPLAEQVRGCATRQLQDG